ncbi:MAG TPA: GNAT family N-acetyltransferase [Bdellovibrionales bacterium]|nr:GNAT family N-acetyltransferase [Bdellovibrionales bacterium]
MTYALEELTDSHQDAFLQMLQDFQENDPHCFETHFARPKPWSPLGFQSFLRQCAKERLDWRPGPNKTSQTRYVLIDGDATIVGFAILRFPLDTKLEAAGGNVVFAVPPKFRKQGFGALTLNRMLFEAARAGMARLLVTCPKDNLPARKCIEKNRGEKESEDAAPSLRYWIPLR